MTGPGLPRPRLARVLRRRDRDDRATQRHALSLGAALALGCSVFAQWIAAAVAIGATVLVVAYLARRILRRAVVIAALGEVGGVVVGSEGGEHVQSVQEPQGHREADR